MKRNGKLTLLSLCISSSLIMFAIPSAMSLFVESQSTSINININNPIVTYYFIDQSWWNAYSASSYAYMWNYAKGPTSFKVAWPGEPMTWQSYNGTEGRNTWYIDVNLDLYDRLIVERCSSTGEAWGPQTVDITLDKSFNTIYLWNDNSSPGNVSLVMEPNRSKT